MSSCTWSDDEEFYPQIVQMTQIKILFSRLHLRNLWIIPKQS